MAHLGLYVAAFYFVTEGTNRNLSNFFLLLGDNSFFLGGINAVLFYFSNLEVRGGYPRALFSLGIPLIAMSIGLFTTQISDERIESWMMLCLVAVLCCFICAYARQKLINKYTHDELRHYLLYVICPVATTAVPPLIFCASEHVACLIENYKLLDEGDSAVQNNNNSSSSTLEQELGYYDNVCQSITFANRPLMVLIFGVGLFRVIFSRHLDETSPITLKALVRLEISNFIKLQGILFFLCSMYAILLFGVGGEFGKPVRWQRTGFAIFAGCFTFMFILFAFQTFWQRKVKWDLDIERTSNGDDADEVARKKGIASSGKNGHSVEMTGITGNKRKDADGESSRIIKTESERDFDMDFGCSPNRQRQDNDENDKQFESQDGNHPPQEHSHKPDKSKLLTLLSKHMGSIQNLTPMNNKHHKGGVGVQNTPSATASRDVTNVVSRRKLVGTKKSLWEGGMKGLQSSTKNVKLQKNGSREDIGEEDVIKDVDFNPGFV